MAVKYRNKKSKKVATFTQVNPRLERSKGWERVDDKPGAKVDDKPAG